MNLSDNLRVKDKKNYKLINMRMSKVKMREYQDKDQVKR